MTFCDNFQYEKKGNYFFPSKIQRIPFKAGEMRFQMVKHPHL